MFDISGRQREIVLNRRGGNESVSCPHPGRKAVFLNIDHRSMSNVFGEWEDGECQVCQKLPDDVMLLLVMCTLKEFQVRLDRKVAVLLAVNQLSRVTVSSLYPDENVGIKDH
jgi:hypothetical protein